MDVFLAPEIADDTARACFPGDPVYQLGPPSNERDVSAARRKIADQRQSET